MLFPFDITIIQYIRWFKKIRGKFASSSSSVQFRLRKLCRAWKCECQYFISNLLCWKIDEKVGPRGVFFPALGTPPREIYTISINCIGQIFKYCYYMLYQSARSCWSAVWWYREGLARIHLPRAACRRREQMPAIKKKKCACTKAAAAVT